jgi:flagellar protein FlaG
MKITEHLPQVVSPVASRPEAKPPSRPPTTPPPQGTNTKEAVTQQDLPAVQEVVAVLNEKLELDQRSIRFRIEEETNEIIVTVRVKETGELVRQIPAEVTLRLAAHLDDLNGALLSSYG